MTEISLIRGDITKLELDCIMNAANEQLMPGGGVCGAIHQIIKISTKESEERVE